MKLRKAPFPIAGMDDRHVMFVVEYLKTRKASVAAEAVGYSPDHGHKLMQLPDVQLAVTHALANFYLEAQIDAEWVLREAVDNHYLCRQMGNLAGSNQALNLIAKHAQVDAFAAEKIELASDEQIRERLVRARMRRHLQTPEGERVESDSAPVDVTESFM